jgi:tRNA G26 N,N-dimethylase Trm1
MGCMHSDVVQLSPKVQNEDFDHKIEGCTGPIRVAGPLWIGDLFKEQFLNNALKELEKSELETYHRKVPDVLEKLVEESSLTDQQFIDIHALCDLHGQAPPKNQIIIEKLKEQGYQVARTHFKPTAIRTTASVKEVAKIITDYNVR